MELTALQVTRIRAAVTEIQQILDALQAQPPQGLDDLVQAWVTQHLRYAPGHRVRADDARAQFQRDTGITVNPQEFGLRVHLSKKRSNGHTWYQGVKLT